MSSRARQLLAFKYQFSGEIVIFLDVLARASQNGAHTEIDLGGGNMVTIENTDLADLSPANFFVI